MEKWGFWDWVGYAVLGVSALIEAGNTSLHAAPDLSGHLPSFFTGSVIGYLPLAFFGVATLILVGRALGIIPGKREPCARKPKTPSSHTVSPSAAWSPLVEMDIGISRLHQAAPWLEIFCTCFNASGYAVRALSADGRIKVNGQEFHGHIELASASNPDFKFFAADEFFRFGIKIPVSESEVKYLDLSLSDGHLQIGFVRAAIALDASTPVAQTPFSIPLPERIHFNTKNYRTEPFLPWQRST